jgi:hypothetical protein
MGAGKKIDPGPLTFPMPIHVSEKPQILALEELISARLSTYIGMGVYRAQDYADVVDLVKANHTSRDLGVAPKIRDQYQAIWDGLHGQGRPI